MAQFIRGQPLFLELAPGGVHARPRRHTYDIVTWRRRFLFIIGGSVVFQFLRGPHAAVGLQGLRGLKLPFPDKAWIVAVQGSENSTVPQARPRMMQFEDRQLQAILVQLARKIQ